MHLLAHYLETLAVLIQTWLKCLKKKKLDFNTLENFQNFSLIARFKTAITIHLIPI